MKESHRQDLANQSDPESCVDGRKAGGEALTGATTGQPLNCEIRSSGMPTLLHKAEGHMEQGVIGEPCSNPSQSKTLSMWGNSQPGNREVPVSSVGGAADRSGKGTPLKPDMDDIGKSDGGVVPTKWPNNDRRSAEVMEGRPSTEGNSTQQATSPTQSGINVTSGLQRVREVAHRDRKMRFTCLLHHLTVPLLLQSFYALQNAAAPGSDGVTWSQ